ncbi:hypothetical protein QM407_06775 [Streptococcus parasanguinis]|nr:hypothetical protein HSISS2_1298 [Streptococcus sp. HSISS2]
MDKQTIFYCYRMTHDYGINPCVFTENYDTTPNLLTEGGCMLQLRRNIKKNWADKINSKSVDAYIMAVAGHSNDGKKWRDDQGMFITPKYNHLIFVAKISEILTMKEYLLSPKSNNRRDAYTYQWLIEKNGLNQSSFMNEIVILADRFNYFGKSPLKIPKEILDFFPMGERARMNGKPFPRWNAKNGFYNSEERFTDVLELMEFAETILGSQNKVMDLPYHPFFIRGKEL